MFYKVIVSIAKIIFKVIYKIKIHGDINKASEEGLILCGNHSHILDPVVLAIIYDKPIHFMGKKELFNNKILSKIFSSLNAFPVDRTGNDLKALKHSVKLLKDDKNLGIFIEGTRVKEYNPSNAKPGPIIISNMSNKKIIPVKIVSTYKLFSEINVYIREPFIINKQELKENRTVGYENEAKRLLNKIYNG